MIEKGKEYIGYIIAFFMLLFLIATCNDEAANTVSGEVKILDKQFQNKIKDVDSLTVSYKTLKDSLRKEDEIKDSKILALEEDNTSLNNKINKLEKEKTATLEKVKKFTYKEDAEFLADRYNAPKSVSYTDKGITANDSVPNKIVEDIVEGDFCQEKSKVKDSLLVNSTNENRLLEGKVKDRDTQIISLEGLSRTQTDALDAAKALTEKQKKENKKLKTGKVIDRILIGAAAILGYLIAK